MRIVVCTQYSSITFVKYSEMNDHKIMPCMCYIVCGYEYERTSLACGDIIGIIISYLCAVVSIHSYCASSMYYTVMCTWY